MKKVLTPLIALLSIALVSPATGDELVQWASQATASSSYLPGCDAGQVQGCPVAVVGLTGEYWEPGRWWTEESQWLEVEFAEPVDAETLTIWGRTIQNGVIERVEAIDIFGVSTTISESFASYGTLNLTSITELVNRVRIHSSSNGVHAVILRGWNQAGQLLPEQTPTAARASASAGDDWAPVQATGEPDIPGICDDLGGAWAPLGYGLDPEWLEVRFERPVHATTLGIYETFESGAVYQVDLIDTEGNYYTEWVGTDTTPCPGVLEIQIPQTDYASVGARIYTQGDGWEEIDAVRISGVEQLEPADAVADLISQVISLNLHSGISNALDAKLENALKALEDVNSNNDLSAINRLAAFIHAVEAQAGEALTHEQADSLMAAAETVIAALRAH